MILWPDHNLFRSPQPNPQVCLQAMGGAPQPQPSCLPSPDQQQCQPIGWPTWSRHWRQWMEHMSRHTRRWEEGMDGRGQNPTPTQLQATKAHQEPTWHQLLPRNTHGSSSCCPRARMAPAAKNNRNKVLRLRPSLAKHWLIVSEVSARQHDCIHWDAHAAHK